MSFARFGWEDSAVYVYKSERGYECCACGLDENIDSSLLGIRFQNVVVQTAAEMIAHLEKHQAEGDTVPQSCSDELRAKRDKEEAEPGPMSGGQDPANAADDEKPRKEPDNT